MVKFITYVGDNEVLVTTPEHEEEMIKDWFEDTGRYLHDFTRYEVVNNVVRVTISFQTTV